MNKTSKQIFIAFIIYIAIFISIIIGEYLLPSYSKTYSLSMLDTPSFLELNGFQIALKVSFILLIHTYILFNVISFIPNLRKIKYNYYYLFVSVFIFMISPIYLENSLANYISIPFGNIIGSPEIAILFFILLIYLLLIIKGILFLLVIGYFFKHFSKSKKTI